MEDLVTVYITTLNRPDLLSRALKSVQEQTYSNIEVIVCNDASDYMYEIEYEKIINSYHSSFKKLIYHVNKVRRGACFSRNYAIENSSGKYITGLDDDDIFSPDRISYFINYPGIDNYSFLCSNVKGLNEISLTENLHSKRDTSLYLGKEIRYDDMKRFNFVGNQIFIRRDKIINKFIFDENMPAWQDYDMWFRIIQELGVCLKLNACTMFLDDDRGRERITTSSKAHLGYKKFVEKHANNLNSLDLKILRYVDLLNRKQKINILNSIMFDSPKDYITIIKYYSTYRFPKLYKFYQSKFK